MTRGAWLLLFVAATGATAQQPADRDHLRQLRDSLDGVRDSLPLHQLEARTIDVARVQRDDPLLHLRLGFVAMRLGAITRVASHFDDAASEFEWAAELRPDWPYPWFGLGLAESYLPDRVRTSFGALLFMLGQDRDHLAGAAFAQAVQRDPFFTEAVADYATTVLDERLDAPMAQAISALRTATASPLSWDPRLFLLLGRLERQAGNIDSARAAFLRMERLSPHPAVAHLELARTIALTADTVAALPGAPNPVEREYYTAAESDDPDLVAMVRRDLEPIASDSILAPFDSLRGAARVAWLRHFWAIRDGADLRAPGARLVEHYRRWAVAMRDFRLPPFRRIYRFGIELFQSHDGDFDDRGIVWLRQGAPTHRILWPQSLRNRATDEPPDWGDETWRYERPDGDLVLHFAAHEDEGDYRLVESIFSLGMSHDAMVAESRLLPGLNHLLHAAPHTRRYLAEEERLRSRKDLVAATTTDSWVRHYDSLLPARAQATAIGVSGDKSLVHIVYAVDATTVRRTLGVSPAPVRVRAAFLDASGAPIATLDTLERIHLPDVGGRMIAMRAEVPVPPGSHRIRLGVELSPAVGALFPIDSVVVPQVDGRRFDLSSLVIGRPGHGLEWTAPPADSVWFDGTGVYAASDTLVVMAEAYGVEPGAGHSARLAILRQRGVIARLLSGDPGEITIRDENHFAATTARYRRLVSLHGLAPGNYTVELRLEGPGGALVRRRGITIR